LSDEVPIATTAIDAAGSAGSGAGGPSPSGAPPVYKRRLSNYLLDKRLQLRYVVIVTLFSAIICGTLGTLIYRQEQQASSFLEEQLKAMSDGSANQNERELQVEITRDIESGDRALVGKMALAGLGLVVILSLYLVVMTHKVAGPLYKVTLYFNKMAQGRFAKVTPLRRGDMLQDFFSSFQETNEAMRERMLADLEVMERA
jgi:signal transduction histidine kinase